MSTTRRRLLQISLGAGAAGLAAGVGTPIAAAVLGPGDTVAEGEGEIDVVAVEDLEAGVPYRVVLRADREDAWAVFRNVELGSAYVVRSKDGKVEAFSTVCPHLGCAVDDDPEKHTFVCPCHDSSFALDGARLTGPSKRGLYTLPARVADGRVLVRFRRFG